MKKPVGDMGIKAHYEMPANFVGVHKLLALIIIISLIAAVVSLGLIVREKQEKSFQRFIENAVKNCKQVVVGHLIITPVAGCSERNRTAIISYRFSSLQIQNDGTKKR